MRVLVRMYWKACDHPPSACKRAACVHASTYAVYAVRAVRAYVLACMCPCTHRGALNHARAHTGTAIQAAQMKIIRKALKKAKTFEVIGTVVCGKVIER